MGRWVPSVAPQIKQYPAEIAAKLVRDCKSLTHDEAAELVIVTRDIHDRYTEQQQKIIELEQQLSIAQAEVRMMSIQEGAGHTENRDGTD